MITEENSMNNSKIHNFNSYFNDKIDRNVILETAKSSNTDKLINSLSKEDKEKLNSILNDRKAIEEMLKSPQAAAIIKMLSGGSKNG